MASFPLNVLTYNTHLFGGLVIDGWVVTEYQDDARHQQLKAYLSQSPRPVDVVGLQEVWSNTIADDLKNDLSADFPGFYKRGEEALKFNRSGLCLMTAKGIGLSQTDKYDYISNCDKDGFADQDKAPGAWKLAGVTSKGYLQGTLSITSDFSDQIPAGETVTIGLFTTHMPTNASKHPQSIQCCFQSLGDAVTSFMSANPSAAVIVTGDLNTLAPGSDPYSSGRQQEYQDYVRDILLADGLTDAYASTGQDGCTVVGATNLLWQHFNTDKTPPYAEERIDYVFYKDSQDGSVSISVNSAEVVIDDMLRVGDVDDGLDVSDHYPLMAQLQVTTS